MVFVVKAFEMLHAFIVWDEGDDTWMNLSNVMNMKQVKMKQVNTEQVNLRYNNTLKMKTGNCKHLN